MNKVKHLYSKNYTLLIFKFFEMMKQIMHKGCYFLNIKENEEEEEQEEQEEGERDVEDRELSEEEEEENEEEEQGECEQGNKIYIL